MGKLDRGMVLEFFHHFGIDRLKKIGVLLFFLLSFLGFIPKQDTDSSSFRASVMIFGVPRKKDELSV